MALRQRPALPSGLLGMLALVAAIERNLVRDHLGLQNEHGSSWSYSRFQARAKAPGCDVLCLGDSLVKYALLPKALVDRLGGRGFNLAVFGEPPPSSDFLLRRALDAGARASVVVVDFARGFLAQGPATSARSFPWADLLDVGEAADLGLSARDPALFARIALGRSSPSIENRFEVRSFLLRRLRGEADPGYGLTLLLARNWNRNDGATVEPARPFAGAPPIDVPPTPGGWACDPTNDRYVERFLELAARHRIGVFWLLPPITPDYQAAFDRSGDEAAARAYMHEKLRRFPGLVDLDAQHSGYDDPAFADRVHLHRDGARALSAAVARAIREATPAPGPAPRWVTLPAYRRPDAVIPAEDIEESHAAMLALFRESRRVRR